jgi:hypothetical protein
MGTESPMAYGLDYTLNISHVHDLVVTLFSRLSMDTRGEEGQLDDISNVLAFAASSRTSVHHAYQQRQNFPGLGQGVGGHPPGRFPDAKGS